ncbi:hypothetical protein FACS189479_06810 [Spirochaetia bacterium]|nr:hypothetical protein FACS189479_06810 [Spirochaetia bacterium]
MTTRQRIDSLNTTLDIYIQAVQEAGPGATIVSYNLTSPDSGQSTQRRSMSDMVKAIEDLQNLIASLEKSLSCGHGLRTFSTKRHI